MCGGGSAPRASEGCVMGRGSLQRPYGQWAAQRNRPFSRAEEGRTDCPFERGGVQGWGTRERWFLGTHLLFQRNASPIASSGLIRFKWENGSEGRNVAMGIVCCSVAGTDTVPFPSLLFCTSGMILQLAALPPPPQGQSPMEWRILVFSFQRQKFC